MGGVFLDVAAVSAGPGEEEDGIRCYAAGDAGVGVGAFPEGSGDLCEASYVWCVG